jgi:hypothetical protein
MMDEFIEEIKEEVRRDKLLEIWNQYGNYIIGGILAILLITAGYMYWQHRKETALYSEATQYEEALSLNKEGKQKEAEDKLKQLMTTAATGYKTLASFELAKLRASEGQETQDVYEVTMKDSKIPEIYRQLATYKYLVSTFNNAKTNLENDYQDAFNKSPWLPSFKELQALAFIKDGETNKAHKIFVELSQAQDTPPGLRIRSIAMTEEVK